MRRRLFARRGLTDKTSLASGVSGPARTAALAVNQPGPVRGGALCCYPLARSGGSDLSTHSTASDSASSVSDGGAEDLFHSDDKVISRETRELKELSVHVWLGGAASDTVRVTVATTLPGEVLLLHWGVVPYGQGDNHWEAPSTLPLPPGTLGWNKTASQTPLGPPSAEGSRSVTLEFPLSVAPRALNFVLYNPARSLWTHTESGSVFHVPMPPKPAPPEPQPAEAAAAEAEEEAPRPRTGMSSLLSTLTTLATAIAAPIAPAPQPGWAETHSRTEPVTAVLAATHRVGVRVTRHSGGAGVRGRVECDVQAPLLLHWGVVPRGGRDDIWALPETDCWPPGSAREGIAVQSPMPGGVLELEVGTDPSSLRFELQEEGGGRRRRCVSEWGRRVP